MSLFALIDSSPRLSASIFRALQLALLVLCVAAADSISAPQSLTLWNRNFDTAPVDQVVALALQKTEDLYFTTQLIKSQPMEQDQAIEDMLHGSTLDLMSAASSDLYDSQFLTLRFPILKGLLGKRLCLIRAGDQQRFDHIKTAYDISRSKLKICQGKHWPDTEILRRNGLPLVTSDHYEELFTLLTNGQCDCFLRGAQEIGAELKVHEPVLALEKKLVIEYLQPGVVYVRKNNPELAIRIELGLLRAFEDGSYHKLISQLLDENLSMLGLEQRRVITINNPSPSETLQKIDRIRAFDL